MRGRTLAALAALAAVDLAVLALGYRAHSGSLPPFQRSSEAFEVSDSPTTEPTASAVDEDAVVGPVLLGINAAGDVLRATRGACEERFDRTAQIWTGNVDDGDRLAAVAPLEIREVLGVMVYADGKLRVSGLDEGCQPVTFDSVDSGASWQASPVAELWRLSGDVAASLITRPVGTPANLPCPATQIVNLPDWRAIASCSQSTFVRLGPKSQVSLSASEYEQLSATPGPTDDQYFVFGDTEDCVASVGLTSSDSQDVEELQCFSERKAPLAIASAGDLLVIQLGNDLKVSRDDGGHFDTVGQPSVVEGATQASS
jgi:hypothetical protein